MYRRVNGEILLAIRDFLEQSNTKLVACGLPSEAADINAISGVELPVPILFKPNNRFIVGPRMANPRISSEALDAARGAVASWAVHRYYRLQLHRASQSKIPNTYDQPKLDAYKSARWWYYFGKV